jgi:hypothetical protein
MSPISVASKQVIASLLVITVELFLFCTLGTPKSNPGQAFGMIFALIVYVPAPVIFRGLLMVLMVKRWTKKPARAAETIGKWFIFIAPVIAIGLVQMTSVSRGIEAVFLGQFIAYVAVECAICRKFLKLNKHWMSPHHL